LAFAAGTRQHDQAFANASWTRPSFASILTGRYPASHGVMGKPDALPDGVTTLPEALRDGGYATAGWVTNFDVGTEADGSSRTASVDFPIAPRTPAVPTPLDSSGNSRGARPCPAYTTDSGAPHETLLIRRDSEARWVANGGADSLIAEYAGK
jgi:hypothetical protein